MLSRKVETTTGEVLDYNKEFMVKELVWVTTVDASRLRIEASVTDELYEENVDELVTLWNDAYGKQRDAGKQEILNEKYWEILNSIGIYSIDGNIVFK